MLLLRMLSVRIGVSRVVAFLAVIAVIANIAVLDNLDVIAVK